MDGKARHTFCDGLLLFKSETASLSAYIIDFKRLCAIWYWGWATKSEELVELIGLIQIQIYNIRI